MSAFSRILNVLVNRITEVCSMIGNASIPAWLKGFLSRPITVPNGGKPVRRTRTKGFLHLVAPCVVGCICSSAGAVEFEFTSSLDVSNHQISAQNTDGRGSAFDIPYFPTSSDRSSRSGLLRIVNLSELDGDVSITAYDDTGEQFGPVTLALSARQSTQLNSTDIEDGSDGKGLPMGIGQPSQGDWWLSISSDLSIKVLTYIQTTDEFLTTMHDLVGRDGEVYSVGLFNPASETENESQLRIVNPNPEEAKIAIAGIDDQGNDSDTVQVTLMPFAALTLSASDLENGHADIEGSLGDGTGKWRLQIESNQSLMLMSLLSSSSGYLSNLSSDPSLVESTSVDEAPPAPSVTVESNTEVTYSWSWHVEAGEIYAFDHHIRAAGRSWLEFCSLPSFETSGSKTITINFTNDSVIPDETVIEVRYRYRNGSSCTTGSPGPWSAIGSATVGDDSNGSETEASDLTVSAISVSESMVEAGASVTLSATVSNVGDGDASATTLRYRRSANALITRADPEIGTDDVSALDGGATDDQSIQFDVPSTAGTYYFGACVDSVVDESDTSNNCSSAVSVEVTDSGQAASADLVIQSIVLNDVSLTPDQSFTVTAKVRNRGDGASTATTLRYLRSSNSTISTQDTEVGSDTVSTLDSGSEEEESISLTAPSTTGTYYYGVCVDTVADESNTGNNCSPGVEVEVSDEDEPADSYCRPNQTIQPGDRCDIYSRENHYFEVSSTGQGCYRASGITLCGGNSLNYRNTIINGVSITFVASRNTDDSWTISEVEPSPE